MVSVTVSTSRLLIAGESSVEAYLPPDLYAARVTTSNNDKDWGVTIFTSRGDLEIKMSEILGHESDWPNTKAGAIAFFNAIKPLIQKVPSFGGGGSCLFNLLVAKDGSTLTSVSGLDPCDDNTITLA